MGPAPQGTHCFCKAPGWMAKRHFPDYIRSVTIQVDTVHLSNPHAGGLGSLDETPGCIVPGYGCEHPWRVPTKGPWPLAPLHRSSTTRQALQAPGRNLMVGERGLAALVLGYYAWLALYRWEHWGRCVPGVGPGSLLWTSLGWEMSWPLEGPRRGPHWGCPSWSLGASPGPAGQWCVQPAALHFLPSLAWLSRKVCRPLLGSAEETQS